MDREGSGVRHTVIDGGAEIRCDLRDPGGYLIEVGQSPPACCTGNCWRQWPVAPWLYTAGAEDRVVGYACRHRGAACTSGWTCRSDRTPPTAVPSGARRFVGNE